MPDTAFKIAPSGACPPPLPDDEAERIAALLNYAVLDTAPEPEFDRVTAMAQRVFGVSIAVVSLVDSDRQWFKSCAGLDADQTDREVSFCGHAILRPEVMVVLDAAQDPRFAGNPLVVGAPHIRFYAGAPLTSPDGKRIGTLCLIDDKARASFSETDQRTLADLAAIVVDALESRRQSLAAVDSHRQQLLTLSRAVEASTDGIGITDADGIIKFVNSAGVAMSTGDDAEKMIGRSILNFCSEEIGKLIEVALHESRSGSVDWKGRILREGNAETAVNRETTVTRFDDGMLMFVVRDISERLAAERERDALRERLAQSEKLQAIGQLAGGIAHDFNNILSAMLGYAKLLREDLQDFDCEHDEQLEMLDNIITGANRAGDLVAQILAFSRAPKARPGSADLCACLTETATMLRATLPASIKLDIDTPDRALPVGVDCGQLNQIALNLAINARDAMAEQGGRLLLAVSRAESDEIQELYGAYSRERRARGHSTRYWVGPVPDQTVARLTVRDSGPGIAADVIDRIFEPFFTTKNRGRGTGLGLAAVHGIVAAHGGSIAVRNEPGRGVEFSILLPLSEPGNAETDVANAPKTAANPNSISIVLIDDEMPVRDAAKRLLERRGYTVMTAQDGPEALAMVRALPAPPTAVLTDYDMPEMSGLEVLSAFSRDYPGARLFLASGYVSEETENKALAAGAERILKKPLDLDELDGLLRAAVSNTAA